MPIYLVFALTLINSTSVRAANVLLVLYALEFGAQPFTIGLLAATFSVFPILVSVPAGRFADRFGSRWLLLFGSTMAALGMLAPYFVPGLPGIFVAASMVGLLDGIYVVLMQNLVGLLSNEQTRARNFSNYSLAGSGSNLLAPLLAGFSIDLAGHAAACFYLALLTLIPVPLLLWRGKVLPGGARRLPNAASSVRSMMAAPALRRMLAISSLHITGNYLYQFYLPVYAYAIGLSASAIGILLSVNAAAEIAVRLILPSLIARFKEGKLLVHTLYMGAASLLMIPFFESALMLALISFGFGFAMGGAGPIITMLMFANAPQGRSGEALGFRMTVNFATKLASPVLFGSVAWAVGLFHIFWINALLLGAAGKLSRSVRSINL